MISVISKVLTAYIKPHIDTNQANTYSKQDKTTIYFHVFATKLSFILYGKQYSLSPALSLTYTNTNTIQTQKHAHAQKRV